MKWLETTDYTGPISLTVKFYVKENEVSKLLITTTVSDNLLRQILRQINKLIDVLIAKEEI